MLHSDRHVGVAATPADLLGDHPCDPDPAWHLIALNMPKKGIWVPVCLVLMSLPLLIPWNVVGTIWQIFGRVDIGLLGHTLGKLGIDYNYTQDAFDAWITLIVMDVWHWTSLVALSGLCRAAVDPRRLLPGRQDRPGEPLERVPLHRAAEDQGVLMIAILLRFMDSFMIYTEPFVVTGGGPGSSTNFLSIDLVNMAIGQFDLGPAAAYSIMYFLVILLICYVFYTVMTNLDKRDGV
jgi:glycerol transport system permease protein